MVTALRLDNIGIVVDDLDSAIAYFTDLGLERVGEATVEGDVVDRLLQLEGVRSRIAMLRTPDGHSQLELSQYVTPPAEPTSPPPHNTLGLHRIALVVDDVDAAVAVVRDHRFGLVGEVVQYEDSYRMCYARGPAGIIVMLVQELG
ncbi:glyoxalase [Luteimicrobium album]|uniref:Glyoxalase n=1 Tax=Luteimicrobium album TaxID=1054550 RepID=A0ABQ6I7P6_9MICO|nr:VOC family protein [Luteimicrobium album]GMA25973.1 glyoxalase [Luteimicrobium album]